MSGAYSLRSYGAMINDGVRAAAYDAALREVIQPGAVVVELGTGYGGFAMRACALGARHVYAIEPADAIGVGRRLAKRHGLEDRITFFQALSQDVDLPERADLLLSDIRGSVPLIRGNLEAIADARNRFLKPGATIVARRDRLLAGLVDVAERWSACVEPWGEHDFGVDMSPASDLLANDTHRLETAPPEVLLGPGVCWDQIDYATEVVRKFGGEITLSAERAGTAHGLAVWFDTDLTDNVGFSNGLGHPPAAYGRMFLPFRHPIAVQAGDVVDGRLEAHSLHGRYLWRWTARHRPAEGPVSAQQVQSTFFGADIDPVWLARHELGFQPRLKPERKIEAFLLPRMDGRRTNEQLAQDLLAALPDRVRTVEDAREAVGRIAGTYAQ